MAGTHTLKDFQKELAKQQEMVKAVGEGEFPAGTGVQVEPLRDISKPAGSPKPPEDPKNVIK